MSDVNGPLYKLVLNMSDVNGPVYKVALNMSGVNGPVYKLVLKMGGWRRRASILPLIPSTRINTLHSSETKTPDRAHRYSQYSHPPHHIRDRPHGLDPHPLQPHHARLHHARGGSAALRGLTAFTGNVGGRPPQGREDRGGFQLRSMSSGQTGDGTHR